MSPIKNYLLLFLVSLALFFGLTGAVLAAPPAQEGDEVGAAHVRPNDPIGFVQSGYLNVRTGPDTSYQAFTSLSYGERVLLVGRNTATSWLEIQLWNGKHGWVFAQYINAPYFNFGNLPVTDGGNPGPINPSGTVNSYILNVRSGPSLGYPVIHELRRGEMVILAGRNQAGTWLRIQVPGGGLGWVSANYIWSQIPISNLPVVDDGPQPQPLTGSVGVYSLNVRSGAGLNYPVTAMLRRGQQVYLNGRNSDSSWIKISLANGGSQGWVSARYIWSQTPISQLPVVW